MWLKTESKRRGAVEPAVGDQVGTDVGLLEGGAVQLTVGVEGSSGRKRHI